MATQLFLRDTVADIHLGTDNANLIPTNVGWVSKALATTRGPGVVASDNVATVTGPTNGVIVTKTDAVEWISPPVSADVTISGTITLNIWGEESNMSANVAINVFIEVIRANTTTTRNSNTLVTIAQTARTTELVVGVGVRAVNNFTVTPTSTVVNRGDRLRVRIYGDDSAAATMASGFTFDISYSGTTGAADGDTFVTFTETITFESAPSGTQLFLTNVQSGLTGAPTLVSDFTGADENPLSEGGNWAALNSSTNQLQRISNAVGGQGVNSYSYWTPTNFGPDLDAYITISTISSFQGIAFRIQGEGGANTWDGYAIYAISGSTSINKVLNGTFTSILDVTTTWASGDKLGIRISGSLLQAWRQASGSSDWTLICTVVDTTYAAAGKIGVFCNSTTVRVDDFYAATNSNLFTQQAWTSRGAGVVFYQADTDAGWVAPLYTQDWYSKQLQAFTLTGLAKLNFRALETDTSANVSIRGEIARVDADGTNATVWASWCMAPVASNRGELATGQDNAVINMSGDDLVFTDGQRIRIRLYLDDMSSAAMANGFAVWIYYNGTSGGASGDAYLTLAQTVSEFVSSVPGPASSRRQRRASRFLTFR